MRKIVIIGANSSLARNFIYYIKNNIKCELFLYDLGNGCSFKDVFYRKIDYTNIDDIASINYDCDQLYIFSGLTGPLKSLEQPIAFLQANEWLLIAILENIRKTNSKCTIVYPSSRLVYDESRKPLREQDHLLAKSIYSANKIAAENFLNAFHTAYDIRYVVFRIAIPFGIYFQGSKRFGIVSTLEEQAKNGKITIYGDGKGKRTFTHIYDICKILCDVPVIPAALNEVFNIGGQQASILSIATALSNKYGAEIEFVDWPEKEKEIDVSNGALDDCKLRQIYNIKYKKILFDD